MNAPNNRFNPAQTLIFVALSVIFAISSQAMPLFGLVAPLPSAMAALSLSLGNAVAVGVITAILEAIAYTPLAGVQYFCQFALVGIVVGWMVTQHKRYGQIFGGAMLAQIGGMVVNMASQLAFSGFNVAAFLATYTNLENTLMDNAKEMNVFTAMATQGISASEAEASFRQTLHTFIQVIPAVYFVLFGIMAGILIFLVRWVCRSTRKPYVVPSPSWESIIVPVWVIVPFILAWVLILANRFINNEVLWICALNVMVIGAACMAVDGFSYIIARLKLRQRSQIWQLAFLLLAFLMSWYLIIFFALVGIFDAIVDYRHLRHQEKETDIK
ncbi:MAG: DUF2232 domain-containing protein [Peptococcaceae bacterium]|nr:DUF2232 domain-containing protein [Peptococcaceae bacterium]